MVTRTAIERRVARLEARALIRRAESRPDSFPPQSSEALRVMLGMLIEMGALTPPPVGQRDRWQGVRLALFGPDLLPSDDDQHALG